MPPASEIFAPDALDGRVAIVTGGGTNLGRAVATELAACGAHVVIAGRRAEVLEEAAALIGERCSTVSGDIREPDQAAAIVDAALERHGRLDVLVNNAGGQYFVPAEAITAKGWRAVHPRTYWSTGGGAILSSPPRQSPPRAGAPCTASTSTAR